MSTISIRGIEAKPGEKITGRVTMGEWIDGSPIQVPISIVNGKEDGPVFLAIACSHGDEQVGTDAIRRLIGELDPQSMRGAVIGVLAANAPAFLLGERVNTLESPAGANDLRRLFRTAKPTGSLTERLGAFLRDEVASQCDYYADLHTSARGSVNHERAIIAGPYVKLSDELRKKVESLAEGCGMEYILRASDGKIEGMLFLPTFHVLEEDFGKAGIVIETGLASSSEGVEIPLGAMRNILITIGILDGEVKRTGELTYLERFMTTRADLGGLWEAEIGAGALVTKGDVLGHIYGLDGEMREEIVSPTDGVIMKVTTTSTVMTGDRTHVIGVRDGEG